jgi:hypothetical protein
LDFPAARLGRDKDHASLAGHPDVHQEFSLLPALTAIATASSVDALFIFVNKNVAKVIERFDLFNSIWVGRWEDGRGFQSSALASSSRCRERRRT